MPEAADAAAARRGTNVLDAANLPRVDFYARDELLTAEERAVRDRVRRFVDREVIPIAARHWERAETPAQLLPKPRALGIAGGDIQGYGCPGLSAVANGPVRAELARGDAGTSTMFAVHSSLAMTSTALRGSEEQKGRWLPPMARMKTLGASGLTEPAIGSDAAHLETRARRDGDTWVLDGAKRWIGNGHFADVAAIWARDEAGKVGGFLVERGTAGFAAHLMAGKWALRGVGNADITLTECRVPLENRLAHANGFRDTARVLTVTRYGVACGALGNATACYEAALAYASHREQFGKPIAGHQLIQQKLAWMLTEITRMQLLCWRLGRLLEAGRMTPEQASLAKYYNAAKARQIAALAREVMGGNGILLDNLVARHQARLAAIYSYEGTDQVRTLVGGRAITGQAAFCVRSAERGIRTG